MSGQEGGLNNELKQQIAAFQKEMLPKIPPAIREVLVRTTEDQVKSGIADKALKVGDKAPDFTLPNGLAFSPDESVLYVNDSRRGHIRAFDVLPTGGLALSSDRVFADLSGERPGVPDGMKVDTVGRVFCTGSGGIWVFAPDGSRIGVIRGPEVPRNIAFGGPDYRTVYTTPGQSIYSFRVVAPGIRP